MEKILDREDKEVESKKLNGWIPVVLTNFILIFISFLIIVKSTFLELGICLLVIVLLNVVIMLSLLFSSSSNWKKWAIALLIILILILGIALDLYISLKNL